MLEEEIIHRGGSKASSTLDRWIGRKSKNSQYEAVQNHVFAHDHEVLYGLDYDQVRDICSGPDHKRTQHAIADISFREALPQADDFNVPFALEFMLHYFLETQGALYRWNDFYEWFRSPSRGGPAYYNLFLKAYGKDGQLSYPLERALQLRIGNAYYSFLREVEFFTRIRSKHGIDLKYHMLADVLYRIDFWHENTIINLFVGNSRFRSGNKGRKKRTDQFLEVNNFAVLDVEIESKRVFGRPWLISGNEERYLVSALRKDM